ncbi:MAG: endonuclease/exonuclease/phosphatase family protein [Paludibacter sp.]|nr:endonuclease/exonuclease/phosphatase family protein [Paludibacter sp.]
MNLGKGLIKLLFITANLIVAVLMVMAFIASRVSPEKLLIPAYTTLLLPALIPLNIFFVFFWMLLKKWHFLISLSVILLCWTIIKNTIPLNFNNTESFSGEYNFSLMTYNTYANAMMAKHAPKSPNPVIQYMLDKDPDILCIQEYSASARKEHLTEEDLLKIFQKYPYHHIHFKVNTGWSFFGNATFSKFPIVNKSVVEYQSNYNTTIFSDVNINGKIIRVFNCHLESNKITENDKVMAIRLKDNFDTEHIKGTTMHFSRKLGGAYRIRAKQADVVSEKISESPYPVLVVGDFNDLPSSYTYTTIRQNLQDAFVDTGLGLGWTFSDAVLKFRIDHVLYDASLKLKSFKLDNKTHHSDHFPLYCKFSL